MISFRPLPIAGKKIALQELTFNQMLKVSVIDAQYNEKRLSAFIEGATSMDPLTLTVQERYAILIHYLMEQSGTFLDTDIEFSSYKPKLDMPWQESISINGVTVRQLFGCEAERLEADCKSIMEWLACSMAMQLSYEGHEHLGQILDIHSKSYEQEFLARLTYFKHLPAHKWESYFDDFQHINSLLFSVIELSISKQGFVVLGGADDAPMRFCTSAIFTNTFARMDELYFTQSQYPSDEHQIATDSNFTTTD